MQGGKFQYWVGLNDHGIEGTWRFSTDNSYFDPDSDGTLFKWAPNEPNNLNGENCAVASNNFHLNDVMCPGDDRHGLCEIKVFDC